MTKDENYAIIRERLASVPCSEARLKILKENFREKIDSDRRYDRISSLADLVKILEKRDIINPDNITAVKSIARLLQRDDILNLINILKVTPPNPQTEPVRPPIEPEGKLRVLPTVPSDPIEKVYNLICMEIGQKWKDLARCLKVREGFIDELEFRHKHISEMVREIITYHRQNCDSRYWQYQLTNALIDARRRDLGQEVQQIFAMHNCG